MLLDAAAVLLCKRNDEAKVMNFACSNECPGNGCVATPNRGITPSRTLPTGDATSALDSACALIEESGFAVEDSLKRAFLARCEAQSLLQAGQAAEAEEQFSATLAEAPAELFAPAHAPIEGEPAEWDASLWKESLFDSQLRFDQSCTTYEYGQCGKGSLQLLDCEVDGCTLRGQWEGDLGEGEDYGHFEVTMRDDGRGFRGTLQSEEGGTEHAWSGRRIATSRVRRTERPPWSVRWLFESFQGRARARLALEKSGAALEDAKAAVELCCRAPAGYALLEEVALACGDEATSAEAREELAWLRG